MKILVSFHQLWFSILLGFTACNSIQLNTDVIAPTVSSPPNGSGSNPQPTATPIVVTSGPATCGSNNPISAASFYPCSMYFNMPITNQPVDPQTTAMTNALQANGAWGGSAGNPRNFGITGMDNGTGSGIDVYYTNDPVTPPISVPVDISNDSASEDPLPTIPLPSGGSTKGFEVPDQTCGNGTDGDCHYTVMDLNNQREVDSWVTVYNGTKLTSGGGPIIWPLTTPAGGWYQTGRGTGCTSADATGLPISPLLFSVEEIAAGHIYHAIRFILNNNQMAHMGVVWPGTHATYSANAPNGPGIPYGAYLRLKPTYDITTLPCGAHGCGAQVIAKALQTYGMILADGGVVTLTAKSARYSALNYADYFSSDPGWDLSALHPSDFEVVQPPGVPTAMPSGPPASFVSSGQGNGSYYTQMVSTIASNPTVLHDLTCYRNTDYAYLNASVTNPPAATAAGWTNSESNCSGGVTTIMAWLNCQLLNWNN